MEHLHRHLRSSVPPCFSFAEFSSAWKDNRAGDFIRSIIYRQHVAGRIFPSAHAAEQASASGPDV